MKKNLSVLLITVIAIAGCLPQTSQSSPTATGQNNPTPESVNTATVVPSTATTTFTSSDMEANCISITPAPHNMMIEGTVVFLDHLGQSIVLMGENELRIPEEFQGNNGNSEQSVSPDGNLLMYRQVQYEPAQSNLVLVTSNGQVVHDFPDEHGWASGATWLTNEYIRYPIMSQTDNEQLTLYTLNIQTGQLYELRTDLPDMADNGSPDWGIDSWAIYFGFKKGVNIVYDSSLTRVVYPKIRASYPFYPVTLYDVQNNKELAVVDLDYSVDPKWSPNGEYFSMIGRELATPSKDIYIVGRDGGHFMPLTNLAKLYPEAYFGSYSWSPDSRYIAFWVDTEGSQAKENASSLILFDLATMKMTDLCIKGIGSNPPLGIKTSFNLHGKPIWSPDGRKLLITRYEADRQEVIDLLIDLENEIAYPVATDIEPIGWMK